MSDYDQDELCTLILDYNSRKLFPNWGSDYQLPSVIKQLIAKYSKYHKSVFFDIYNTFAININYLFPNLVRRSPWFGRFGAYQNGTVPFKHGKEGNGKILFEWQDKKLQFCLTTIAIILYY